MEDYARGLFAEWGIGLAEQDNGVLLLVAVQDRRDRIEVGLGLEDQLTDDVAQQVLDVQVQPLLAAGSYAAALNAGVQGVREALGDPLLTDATAGDPPADAPPVDAAPPDAVPLDPSVGSDPFGGGSPGRSNGPPVGLFVVLGFLLVVLSGLGRAGRRYGAYGAYGRRPGYGRALGTGMLFGSVLGQQRRGGFGAGSGGGFGGSSGGGCWGGGGGSWGGGGGFGGGSSGGGGASGGW